MAAGIRRHALGSAVTSIGADGLDDRVRTLARVLWDYHQLRHDLVRSDAILVLCSHDLRVAERGAELFLEGWGPLLIFSGGLGSITRQLMTRPEADQFADVAERMGVPPDRILIENQSTNTGENVRFTRALVASRGLDLRSFILVQKPYMERRSFATFRRVWPEPEVRVTSPQVSMDDYLRGYGHAALSARDVVSIMVGDLQRIRVYAERGFLVPQEIPDHVWTAYEELVRAGLDQRRVPP
jgi:uncharacterized SAM-binding protein YcdF (DUF218 family)